MRDDSDYTLGLVLDHCVTRDQQDRAIAALGFKCDVLWSMVDAIAHHAERGGLGAAPQESQPQESQHSVENG